ncbi:porin [Hydrogenophaga soli]
MKKKLLALTALVLTTGAFAQSSYTLYGRIDTSIGGIKELGKGTQSKMFHGGVGGLTTSRWGIRGSEDLGGGLKAVFKLEQRLDSDTGAAQSPSFKGESSVGFAGSFGKIVAGRMTTVYDDVRGVSQMHSLWDSAFTPNANGVFGSGSDYGNRFNSQIRYESPLINGFYANASYAFEQTTGKGNKMVALALGYKAGPRHISLGYQDEKGKSSYTMLSGAYDLGAVAVSGGYNHRNGNAASGHDNELTLGVNMPMGAWNFSAGIASGKTTIANATTAKANGYAFGATYSLSKRTTLYAAYRSHNIKTGAGVKSTDTQLYAMGVRHDF